MFFVRLNKHVMLPLLIALLIFTQVFAQEKNDNEETTPGGIGISLVRERDEQPNGYFTFFLKPGESVKREIIVSNSYDKPVKVVLFAADAENSAEGALVGTFYKDKENVKNVGKWIKLEATEFELPKKSNRKLQFEITIPPDSTQGDHVGFIFLQPAEEEDQPVKLKENQAGFRIKVVQRIGVFIWQRTPGEVIKSMEPENIKKFVTDGVLNLSFEVKNTGNIFVKPILGWQLIDSEGKALLFADPKAAGYILPGSSIVVNIPIVSKRPIPRGIYKLKVKLEDKEGYLKESEYEITLP